MEQLIVEVLSAGTDIVTIVIGVVLWRMEKRQSRSEWEIGSLKDEMRNHRKYEHKEQNVK